MRKKEPGSQNSFTCFDNNDIFDAFWLWKFTGRKRTCNCSK